MGVYDHLRPAIRRLTADPALVVLLINFCGLRDQHAQRLACDVFQRARILTMVPRIDEHADTDAVN